MNTPNAQMNPDNKTVRSVESLQRLYSSAVALTLYTVVSKIVIDSANGSVSLSCRSMVWAIPFFATLVPFYHGALRHLDETYIFANPSPRPPSLLFDFVLLFLEAGALVWLAHLISDPSAFVGAFVVVLVIDVVWAVLILLVDKTAFERIKWWLYINVGTLLFIGIVQFTTVLDRAKPEYLIVTAVLRTVVDYWKNWPTFFPRSS